MAAGQRSADSITRALSLVSAGLWALFAAPLALAALALPVTLLPALFLGAMAWLSARLGTGQARRVEKLLLVLGDLGALVLAGGMATLERGTDWMEGVSVFLRVLGVALLGPSATTAALLVRAAWTRRSAQGRPNSSKSAGEVMEGVAA